MFFYQFVAVRLSFYLVAGILLGRVLSLSIVPAITLALCAFLHLSVVYKIRPKPNPIWFGIATYAVVVCIGLLAESMNNPLNYPDYFGKDISADKERLVLKIREELKPTPFSQRFIGQVKQRGDDFTSGLVLFEISPLPGNLLPEVDDLLWVWGRITKVAPPLNPGSFNYSKYLENKGILRRVRVEPEAILHQATGNTTLKGIACRIRANIREEFSRSDLALREASVLQALLLGYRNDLSSDTYEAYKASGAVHILAVSGLHVGMLLAFIRVVFRPVSRMGSGYLYLLIQVALLWAFAFVTGLSPSVIRAVSMASFLAYALYINRPSNSYNILGLSILFILLCIDPNLLFQVGFQMSYAAVIGILWIYPVIRSAWKPKHRVSRWVMEIISVSVAAQAGVLPISLLYFHQFPMLFFLTNLFIIPILGIVLGGGLVIMVWTMVSTVPSVVLSPYEKLLWTMNEIIYTIAGFESFTLSSIKFNIPALLLSYLILFGLVNYFKTGKSRSVFLGLSAIVVLQFYWIGFLCHQSGKRQFIVFHRFAESIIAERNGVQLFLRAKGDKHPPWLQPFIRDEGILRVHQIPPGHGYCYNGKQLFVLDSLSRHPIEGYFPDILIVTYSPRVNPDRFLEHSKPQLVVLDGSNYPSHAAFWQKSCARLNIPLHYTAQSGAFIQEE